MFDNYISVVNKKSKVIKYDDNYFVLENIDSTIYLTIHFPNQIDTTILNSRFDDYFIGFDMDSDYIVFHGSKYLYLYNYNGDKSKKAINIRNKPCKNVEIINGNLVLYSTDLSTTACNNKTKTMLNSISIENQTQQLYNFPEPIGIDLASFVPRKIMAVMKSQIAVHDLSEYRIKFYDLEYNYVDSIVHTPIEWKQYEGEIPKYKCDPEIMDHINKCGPIVDNYSKISLINTLNDSTLLLTWKIKDSINSDRNFTYYNDIWTKRNNKWELDRDNSLRYSEESDKYNLGRLDIKAYYYVKNGYLYIIKPFPIDLLKKYYGKKYSEFEDEMNNFYIDNDLQYTCFIFKYVP